MREEANETGHQDGGSYESLQRAAKRQ